MIKKRYKLLFLMFITIVSCDNKFDNTENNFSNYLNLSYSDLADSLINLQVRLDSTFGIEETDECCYKHDDYWNDVSSFAKKHHNKRLWAMAQYRKIQILRYYYNKGEDAQREYLKLADYCNKTGFKELEIVCYSQIADYRYHLQQWGACFETCNKLEPLIDNISYEIFPDKADIYHLIGTYYYHQKEYRIALKYLDKVRGAPRIERNYWEILQSLNTSGLAYKNLDDDKNALKCFNEILNTPFFRQYNRFSEFEVIAKTNIACVGIKQGNYQEAIPVLRNAIVYFNEIGDTAFSCGAAIDLVEIFLKKEQIDSAKFYINKYLQRKSISENIVSRYFSMMGLFCQATGNFMSALAYKDSLMLLERAERDAVVAADILYDKQEQKSIEIKDKEKNLRHNRIYLSFSFCICVLLFAILAIYISYYKKIKRKNIAIVAQIKELQKQYEQKEFELINIDTFSANQNNSADNRNDNLGLKIRDCLFKEKIYHDPNISRDKMVEHLGTNRRYFDEAMQICFKMSWQEYINYLRLKEAMHHLEKSDLTIEEISEMVGFGTLRTFQRQFLEKYDMSPKDFRKMVKAHY